MFYYCNCTIKGLGYFLVCFNDRLVYVGSNGDDIETINKFIGTKNLVSSCDKIKKYKEQLEDYFLGNRKKFDFKKFSYGTEFQRKVWSEVEKIKYGEVKTYAEIAENIGRPRAVRAVATAIGKNPYLIFVPCHRVIGKNGELRGYRGGLKMKEELLTLEKENL